MELREEVLRFAELMERKLQIHDRHRGEEWREFGHQHLLSRLQEKMKELEDSIKSGADLSKICSEAADVGNFAMMISESYEQ